MKVLLSSFADLKMLKAVSLTCHSLSSLARAVIEDQHVFTITNIHQYSLFLVPLFPLSSLFFLFFILSFFHSFSFSFLSFFFLSFFPLLPLYYLFIN